MTQKLSYTLILFLQLGVVQAHADQEIVCDAGTQHSSQKEKTLVTDGMGLVKGSVEQTKFEASLAPSSFLLSLHNLEEKRRIVFMGSSLGAENAQLQSGADHVSCKRVLSGKDTFPPRPAFPLPHYLVCMLDEGKFAGGAVAGVQRQLFLEQTSLHFNQPVSIQKENSQYLFKVQFLSFDSRKGLQILVRDKSSGKEARFQGAGGAFLTSFLFAFTQGEREETAKMLRLGCVYTMDPKTFKNL